MPQITQFLSDFDRFFAVNLLLDQRNELKKERSKTVFWLTSCANPWFVESDRSGTSDVVSHSILGVRSSNLAQMKAGRVLFPTVYSLLGSWKVLVVSDVRFSNWPWRVSGRAKPVAFLVRNLSDGLQTCRVLFCCQYDHRTLLSCLKRHLLQIFEISPQTSKSTVAVGLFLLDNRPSVFHRRWLVINFRLLAFQRCIRFLVSSM